MPPIETLEVPRHVRIASLVLGQQNKARNQADCWLLFLPDWVALFVDFFGTILNREHPNMSLGRKTREGRRKEEAHAINEGSDDPELLEAIAYATQDQAPNEENGIDGRP